MVNGAAMAWTTTKPSPAWACGMQPKRRELTADSTPLGAMARGMR